MTLKELSYEKGREREKDTETNAKKDTWVDSFLERIEERKKNLQVPQGD